MSALRFVISLVVLSAGAIPSVLLSDDEIPIAFDMVESERTSVSDLSLIQQRMNDLESRVAQYEAMPQSADPCGCACNCCCPGWFATADYLNWQIERNDLGYAILDPTGVGVPSAGQSVLSLGLGPVSGARVAVGRRTESGWEVGARYTYVRATDLQTFAPGGGQVLAVLSSPATGLTNADAVTAFSDFDYDVFDLEAGHWVDLSDSLSMLAFGGVRCAFIDHRLQAQYQGGAFVNGTVDVPTNVDAVGGRLGTTMHWNIQPGISLFGTGALSVTAADIDAHRRETNAGVTLIDAQQDTNPIAPAVDLALGARASLGDLSVAVGYEFTNWFNVVSPLEFSDNFNGGTIGPSQRDLGLHGFFASATYSY